MPGSSSPGTPYPNCLQYLWLKQWWQKVQGRPAHSSVALTSRTLVLPIFSPLMASTDLLSSWWQNGCLISKNLVYGAVPSVFPFKRENVFPRIHSPPSPEDFSYLIGQNDVTRPYLDYGHPWLAWINQLLPWSLKQSYLSLSSWQGGREGGMTFKGNQGSANKKRKQMAVV